MVEAVARDQTLVRIDHKNGTIHLGDRGLESQDRRYTLLPVPYLYPIPYT